MIRHIVYGVRNAVVGFVIGVGALYGVQTVWWQFGTYDTANVFEPIGVLNNLDQVEQGGVLELFISFHKQTDIAPEVSRNIICENGNTYQVTSPNTDSSRPSGRFTARLNFTISEDIPVGSVCFFQFQNSYQVNPIRAINKVWASEPFTIIERE